MPCLLPASVRRSEKLLSQVQDTDLHAGIAGQPRRACTNWMPKSTMFVRFV